MADVNEMMAAYAEDARDYATRLKKNLDYSEASIRDVEQICGLLHKAVPRSFLQKLFRKQPSEEMFAKMAKMLGGYIGQVFIRHHGGQWKTETFADGGITIFLEAGDMRIFPVGKVYKRLRNGSEDNLQVFYDTVTGGHKPSGS